ncbi:MAG TPA: 30S ribosome-binding factor RbfA [Clostridiales bacterium]|nr:30S ribosome-binding factor RbfA [Clostridiales bacterium]
MDRTARIAEEIKREVSALIQHGIKDPRLGEVVSITGVTVTRDLRHARILVSVLGGEERRKEVQQALASASGYIRREIGTRIRLRYVPEFHFEMDDSIEHGIYISKLIDKVTRGDGNGD